MLLTVTASSGLSATAHIVGRRTPDGASEASLRWTGITAALLPRGEARIVGNMVYARIGSGDWTHHGSASGIALDVGRELLTHPFLLRLRAGAVAGDRTVAVYDAPIDTFRAYAANERQGIATDLLVGTRSLSITTQVGSGHVVADRFVLVTQAPRHLGAIALGEALTVTAVARYCPLGSSNRARIVAPATSP